MDPFKDDHKRQVRNLATVLVLFYWIGHKRLGDIPQTMNDLWKHGHDGLNWQRFAPIARVILATVRYHAPLVSDESLDEELADITGSSKGVSSSVPQHP